MAVRVPAVFAAVSEKVLENLAHLGYEGRRVWSYSVKVKVETTVFPIPPLLFTS